MSTRRVQSSAIKPRTLGTAAAPWVRNPSWRALTAVGDSEQRFRGLVAVFPQSSYLALSAAGNYTVDWGDGSSDNVNSGVTANKLYDFNDVDLDNTNAPVTLTDAGDLVERTAHGYSNGMEVRFYNIVSTTGLTEAQTYYVINATANNFQVTTKVGDATQIVALTTNGSATLLPYKQAIVTVTPNGGTLTSININVKNTTSGLQTYEAGWLDIEVGSPNFTSITLGGSNVRFAMLERAAVRSIGSITNLGSLFANFIKLQSVVLNDTAAVTNWSGTFTNCFALVTVPLFNTSAATNMINTFNTCLSLTSVPLFNTAAVTSTIGMFFQCTSLPGVPLFNTAAVTSMDDMFRACTSLATIPLFNTAAVTSISGMFRDCVSLSSVPALNVSTVSSSGNFSNMFNGCYSLSRIQAANFNYTFSVASCKLGATELNEIYTNLPTVATTQTITVTGNYGTAGATPSIAEDKGWTVAG